MNFVGENNDIPVIVPAGMEADPGAIEQIVRCRNTPGVDYAALNGDHHKGYAVPIGGVIASRTHVSPSGVGYDIGCGNRAVLTNLAYDDIAKDLPRIMDDIYAQVSFGMGRKNAEPAEDDILDNPCRWVGHPVPNARELAASQLGTVGSGNHYVDLMVDEEGFVWIGVHFGSRGLGHKTATYFLKAAGATDNMDAEPCMIPVNTPLGQDYLTYMALAGDYAYAGRNWVCNKVLRILGGRELDSVHNHHNYAWGESHGPGDPYFVVRKGATPAFPGQRGFIGGSMGDICVIGEGKASEQSMALMNSTVHGAGRVMSRTQAAGKYKRTKVWQCGQRDCNETTPWAFLKPGEANPRCPVHDHPMRRRDGEELVRPGVIDWDDVQSSLRGRGLELRGAGADEAPGCYKPLASVLAAHAESINILHTLRPVGVAMAGRETVDPYKD